MSFSDTLYRHSVKDLEDTHKLEAYWQKHRIDQGEADGKNAPKESTPERHQGSSHQRKTRALSDAAASGQNTQSLSVDHPALSLTHHLDIFGPSLFVLYRAALARKRILLLTHPPVRSACDLGMSSETHNTRDATDTALVYNMSILANIPPHCAELLRDPDAMFPLRPLFNVGVHDIGYLSDLANAESGPESYIACSTDEILATKQDLYDILVELPQEATEPGKKHWPKLRNARGDHIRATQRDLRRYRALKKELVKIEHSTSSRYRDEEDGAEDEDTEEEHEAEDYDDTTPLNQKTRGEWGTDEEGMALSGEADLVEPTSWAAVAYTGFLWWASAGEKDSWLEEEASQDGALLSDLPLPSPANHNSSRQVLGDDGGRKGPSARNGKAEAGDAQAVAMDVIAFAHRLTTMTLESMSEMVAAADEENDDNGTNGIIHIESEDLRRMGLDVWSEADGEFARDMFELYFQREAEVRGQGVECCGIKIC